MKAIISVECPNCHMDLIIPWNIEKVQYGGANCKCGFQFEYRLSLASHESWCQSLGITREVNHG